MLQYSLINKKPVIKKDGDSYIDLMADTYRTDANINVTPLIVNEHYVARPDLIAFAIYGDDKYGDLLCKYNGISNPYELNEDDIIYIPAIDDLRSMVKKTIIPSSFIEDPSTDTIQKKDKNNFQKRKNETRSPNEQTIGDSIYTIDKSLGLVFY